MTEEKIVEYYRICDLDSSRHLRLIFRWKNNGGNFHSLVLEGDDKKGDGPAIVITKNDFQGENISPRWIAGIHSFNYEKKTAIIQVGEGPPPGSDTTYTSYSWREWDIEKNMEIKLIMVCETRKPWDRPNIQC